MIIAITGRMGSGKTLLLSYLAKCNFDRGLDIVSNYRLTFPHKIITKKDIIGYTKGKGELSNCAVLIDECQIMLDCRSHHKNQIVSYWLLQSRKRSVSIYYTTQQFFNVEKRLRENTDYIIECQPLRDPSGDKEGKDRLKAIRFTISRYEGRNTFTPMKTGILPNPGKYYALYNTYQIIDVMQD
jgi:hypothetical protein